MNHSWKRSLGRTLLPCLLAALFAAICASSLLRKSSTWDETHYLGLGLPILLEQDWEATRAKSHPPLTYVVHSLPLLFFDVSPDVWRLSDASQRGQSLMDLVPHDGGLQVARLALLPFGVGLCIVVFLWGRRQYGYWGGVIAMTLCCFSPNIIAHGRLITADVTLTFFSTLLLFLISRNGDRSIRDNLLIGVVAGLMLLTKYTGILFLGLFAVCDVALRSFVPSSPSGARPRLHGLARTWLTAVGLAGLILWAGYGFEIRSLSLGDLTLPVPAASFVEGFLFQWANSARPVEHGIILLDGISKTGWWYYYLVCAAIKLPTAVLLLIVALWPHCRRGGVEFERGEAYLLLPALLFVGYLSVFSTTQVGFRYALPALPPLLVLLGKHAVAAARSRWRVLALSLLCAWVIVGTIRVWPHYIPHVNELFGGPRNAHRLLDDSNVDWGQDLMTLKRYLDDRGIERVQLACFGSTEPRRYGIDYDPAGSSRERFLAVSSHFYRRFEFFGDPNRFLYAYRPDALVGYSILIFDLENLVPIDEAARTASER